MAPDRPAASDASSAPTETVAAAVAVAATAVIVNHTAPADNLFGVQTCGATLTAPSTLVTAAHCVRKRRPSSLDVIIGADNLCRTAPITGERLQVKAVRIHPDPRLDLATLTTVQPARTTPVPTGPIPVDDAGGLVAVGWGRSDRGGPAPCRKRIVPLTTAGPDTCKPAEKANPGRWHPNQLCAVAAPGSERNTCVGDSGGPVYRVSGRGDAQLEFVAVINWGTGCEPDQPGFYSPARAA
jgi:secreted trypsin-like serine protease